MGPGSTVSPPPQAAAESCGSDQNEREGAPHSTVSRHHRSHLHLPKKKRSGPPQTARGPASVRPLVRDR